MQEYLSGKFRKYDYGTAGNMEEYGTVSSWYMEEYGTVSSWYICSQAKCLSVHL